MEVDPQRLIQGLTSRGVPRNAAIGFVGNFGVESQYNPGINETSPLVEGSRGGFGFSQWTGPRRRQLESFARDRGAPVADEDTQLDFLVWELNNTEKRARDQIYAASSPEDAARLVSEKFLRPGIPHLERRIQEASRLSGGSGQPIPATGGGTASLSGQQAADILQPITTTPQQAASVYQAYISGQMSPDQAAAYQADVAAGRMTVPEGASLDAPQQAEPVAQPQITSDPNVVANVYRAFASGQMDIPTAQEYARDVQAGRIGIPEGVTPPSDPLIPSADAGTQTTSQALGQPDPRFQPDLTQQFAAESGGDLARQAIGGLTGSGPSPTGAAFPNAPGFVQGAGDAGLAALGGLGALGGAAAGAVGDVAEAAGVPRAPQLARDLAAFPEALAGSPVSVGQSAQRAAVRAVPDAVPDVPASTGRENVQDLLAQARGKIAQRTAEVGRLSLDKNPVRMQSTDGRNALVSPSADLPGMWRVTTFGADGKPSGHIDTADKTAALTRALEDGYSAPTARIEPPITREIPEPRQLNATETNEMRSLIARAANNNTAARNQLAELARVDPEAKAAADRLGISAPTDVFATNAGVQQAAGIVRAVRGSDASVEWEDTFTAAQRRANELIEAEGGTTDVSAISARVQDDLTKSIDTLRADAGVIYNEVRDAIPTGTRLSPDASTRALNGILEDLGGPESLTGPVRGLFDTVTSDQGVTYGRLIQERGQIGRAIAKNQGPYADADSRTLGQLYAALGEDQMTFVRGQVGEDAATRLQDANKLWTSAKDLEADLVSAFGKDQQGSIANTLRTALTNASRGDAGRLNRILNVVPKDLQRETLLTGLADLSQARSGQGGFSFAQYAKTYRGLRDNSEVYARVAPVLGDQTSDLMRDLYEVSIRMDRASQNVPRTGQSNQALIADGLINNVLNSSVGRTARGMAAGVGASAVGGPALGSLAAVGASSTKVGKSRAEAVSRLFRDPAFQKLAEEAATTGQPSARTINAASKSIAFRRWAGVNGIETPDAWINETIARLASQAPQGETTGQEQ